MADDPFNSSDLELSEEDYSGPHIGKRAIASIVSQSAKDRIESKKSLKALKDVGNAPGTTHQRQYWLELFKQYAAVTLGINDRADKTPTGEDVIRFINRLPNHLQSRHSDGKIGWNVIQDARRHLDRALAFHYPDYNLSRNATLRIDATIQTLLDDGQLTKDPVREKQWLTCQIVKKLATAVLSDAVQQGTKSWDETLAGTFSLVLQAAMASRSGDFTRSNGYTGDEYLKWKDIELVATDDNDNNGLVFKMLIKLFYRKSHKRDKSAVASIELGQLPDDNDSSVDPVKLCIAYALRVGAVKETNWSDLLDIVRARPSKRILWAKPDSPVFYALDRSQQLDMSAPASIGQQRRFLLRAAELIGMLNVPITHDVRRGAAADLYSLKSDTISGDTNKVRRALGHSNVAALHGTTDEYIGREKGDSWATRLDQAPKSTTSEPFGVQMATAPFKAQKLRTDDLDRYCQTNGLEGKAGREKARKALLEAQRQQWAEHQRNILDGVQPTISTAKPQPQNLAAGFVTTDPVRVPLQDITNLSRTDTGTAFVLEQIDPALRTFAGDVLGLQVESPARNAGSTLQEASVVNSMAEGYISMLAASGSPANDKVAVLVAPPDQFIGYLSTVNLVSLSYGSVEGRAAGNSRDAPSRFLFYCQTEECPRSFYTALERDLHQVNCRDRAARFSPSVLDGVQNDVVVPSPAPVATNTTRKRKAKDISKANERFPKPCPDSATCGATRDFANEDSLNSHRVLHHDDRWPAETPCNFPGCQLPRDHYFISREQFRRHLHKQHLLTAEQANQYVGRIIPVKYQAPHGTSKNYLSTMCLFPGCDKGEYTTYKKYAAHMKTHDLTPDQVPQYLPTLDTVRRRADEETA